LTAAHSKAGREEGGSDLSVLGGRVYMAEVTASLDNDDDGADEKDKEQETLETKLDIKLPEEDDRVVLGVDLDQVKVDTENGQGEKHQEQTKDQKSNGNHD